jgi:hypothetical protein
MASSVWFDFWLADGSLGGFCSLGPHGYLAGLVGTGRPYVLVREPDAPSRGYEVRTEGLWAAFNRESADGSHWSWGLEAFGVAFDDPEEAVRSEWGDRTALGFDLEWEAADRVYGEILVGPSERIDFDGFGRAECQIRQLARPKGLAAPVRFEDGRVLRQHLTAEGWVRAWDGSAGGTA